MPMKVQVYGEVVSVVYQRSTLVGLPVVLYLIVIRATFVGPPVGPIAVAVGTTEGGWNSSYV